MKYQMYLGSTVNSDAVIIEDEKGFKLTFALKEYGFEELVFIVQDILGFNDQVVNSLIELLSVA